MSFVLEIKNNLIVIPHIPKTGGYSLLNYLKRNFKGKINKKISEGFVFYSEKDNRCASVNGLINGHIPLKECQQRISEIYGPSLSNTKKILINVVRNPYSWMKSWFFYTPTIYNTNKDFLEEKNKIYGKGVQFPEYIQKISEMRNDLVFPNRGTPTRKYQQMVEWCEESYFEFDEKHFIETSNLATELPSVLNQFSERKDTNFVHENSSPSSSKTNEEMYDDETRNIVEEMFKDDIDFFGFCWEDYKNLK